MKRTNVVWYILGGLALIAVGFVAGYAINGGFTRAALGPGAMGYVRGFRGAMMPGLFLGSFGFGLRWLMMLVFWLGPLAGIVALILVLTRRPAAQPAPPTPPVEPAAPAPAEAERAPSKKK